jgi:RNA polymerase sigma-70 factor, ECF subfamily
MTDWNAIVDRYDQLVWSTVYRLVGDYADASDCYQETFFDAVKIVNKKTVRDWPGLLKYLATVRALDLLRKRSRDRRRMDSAADLNRMAERTVGPEQKAEANELIAHLREALSLMPAAQAEVVCLSCLEHMTYSEIADRMQMTTNAVGVLLHRARISLGKMLIWDGAGANNAKR